MALSSSLGTVDEEEASLLVQTGTLSLLLLVVDVVDVILLVRDQCDFHDFLTHALTRTTWRRSTSHVEGQCGGLHHRSFGSDIELMQLFSHLFDGKVVSAPHTLTIVFISLQVFHCLGCLHDEV